MAIRQVVVLHGLYMSGFVMRPLCARLEKSGLKILNLTYNTLSPDRAAIFDKIDRFIGGKPTALVCHSMGGLVARAYLEANSLQSRHVEKVITLGTPHKGSHIAKQMQQKGFEMLLKNSVEFLLSENGDWPFNAKLYSIAGDLPIGLMPLIAKGSVSDGTVLIDETKLNGMAEHKVFHLSHTSMIYSRQVMDYIIKLINQSE
ncbi:alpha/beta hydrolase [Pseudoalteromonas shioyasakiensis]|jgi:pimeloyl-ACP methyl ester carboxylesterase|uniref:Alpha/beta hydrolase n=2 Tax=Pseudoalteromonas TaxID=53246 RepID=A0ABT6U1T0_9GAMM|nr:MULTISPECIES: alpha/beta hydrolase [Pseudoalteromonas]MDC3189226.1 alpha/beta hydrolase [Pseudoalteromonas elyakovii]KZY43473.1 cob(I)alamin adenolsyltransferase [Pseudoalteromonas shioyasakiensis]MCG9732632.1 alpha/beta hydrolase [Pseudoalteromonas shioyasakiensis]MCO6356811.1 alpha/beta hydrolase [Pseudoalteromonas shioyasakiensis]MCO7207033.1 alpha/beta hydrolase [Pseudoalteromonas sp. CnMc7-37]|tara:strand:+ start:582 stop:1187 length:606 start_codon:yes stop_codon:yes gene_type:complete